MLNKNTEWGIAVDKINHLFLKGQIVLSAPANTTLSTSYTKLTGTFANPTEDGFTGDGNRLTATKSGVYALHGVSDLELNGTSQTATITYSMFVNGADVGYITEHGFTSKNKSENIAMNTFITLTAGDYIEVYAKSTINEAIKVNGLSVIIKGA